MFKSQVLDAKKMVALNTYKAMLLETVTDVYMEAIPVKEAMNFRDVLSESVRDMFESQYGHCKTKEDLVSALMENAELQPLFTKNLMNLAESVAERAEDSINVSQDFPENAITLSDEDRKILSDFEEIEGADDYGKEILTRVVDVFNAEKELSEVRKSQAEEVIASTSGGESELTESVVLDYVRTKSTIPTTLFESIYINKNKAVLNESSTPTDSAPEIALAETLCEYALLETFNSLGIIKFDYAKMSELRHAYVLG